MADNPERIPLQEFIHKMVMQIIGESEFDDVTVVLYQRDPAGVAVLGNIGGLDDVQHHIAIMNRALAKMRESVEAQGMTMQ